MVKRLLVVALALALGFSVVGCKEKTAPPQTPAGTGAPAAPDAPAE